jgi:hypothetical protein
MKPRRPATLTSPGTSGAFLFPSSQPCNRAAQAPLNPRRGVPGPLFAPYLPPLVIHVRQTPSALPLSPFRPVPPRLGKAGAACRPCRPCRPSAAPLPFAAAVRRLPLPRAALCRPVRGFPFPCPVRWPAAGTVKPLPPACRRPRAAPEGRQPLPLPIPCGRPAVRRRLKVGFTNQR